MSHKTAVALGALSQYLRFLIFANSSGFDPIKHLSGTDYLLHPESVLPTLAPTTSDLTKKISAKKINAATPVKSSTSGKTNVLKDENKDEDRSYLDQKPGLHFDKSKSMDETKEGQKPPEGDLYNEEDVNDVAVDTEKPVVKSQEDDLLLYKDLEKAEPRVVSDVTGLAVNRFMVKASHMHSSGDSSFEGASSISSTYAFVIVITAVILLVLYRSLRKHRIGIQHRHSRWK